MVYCMSTCKINIAYLDRPAVPLIIVSSECTWASTSENVQSLRTSASSEDLDQPPRSNLLDFFICSSVVASKHYENTPIQIYRKVHLKKTEHFQIKNSDSFHIFAQNIDCRYPLEPPRWGGSNEYPQSMFLSRNKKNNVYPCKPQFYYIKVGFKGVKTI